MSTNNLSIIQKPVDTSLKLPVLTNWNPLIGIMVFKDQNISSLFYYKLGLDVHSLSLAGPLIAKFRQRRNGYSVDVVDNKARAFFDVRGVINTQLVDTVYDQNVSGSPFESIHEVGKNTYDEDSDGTPEYYIYSENGNITEGKKQLGRFFFNVFESYSTAANQAVTDILPSTGVSTTAYFMKGSLELNTPRFINQSGSVDTDFIQGTAMSVYQMDDNNSLFLSDNPLVSHSTNIPVTELATVSIQDGQCHTLAFLNSEGALGSTLEKMRIVYYNGNSTLSTTYIDNEASLGGSNPMNASGETTTDQRRLLYFGCGPANLEGFTNPNGTQTHKPSNNTGYTHYTVKGVNSATTGGRSQEVLFIREYADCKGFITRRLAFRNSLGAYDYINFRKKSVDSIDVTRNEFSTIQGTFNGSKFRYNDWQRGKKVRSTTATRKETLNTDFIKEEQAVLIERLLMSTDVYVVADNNSPYTVPVMVTDKSFIRKTTANDKLIQYTIKIEYANPVNTNSQ